MKNARIWGLLAIGVGTLGCSADVGGEVGNFEEVEEVGELSQKLEGCPSGVACRDYVTGPLTVRVFQCAFTDSASINEAFCDVTSNFALVGGGAEIKDAPAPGAMITSSYPYNIGATPPYTTWAAESKDHIYLTKHRLRAYAIGLHLDGLSGPQLRQIVKTAANGSGWVGAPVAHPADSIVIPISSPKQILLSGGVRTLYNGDGQLLVTSYAKADDSGWDVASKDHIVPNPGYAFAYVTYMPECPVGLSYCLVANQVTATSSSGGGYRTVQVSAPYSWLPTGVGARSPSSNQRLLTDMHPGIGSSFPMAFASSKDHDVPNPGSVRVALRLLNWRPK